MLLLNLINSTVFAKSEPVKFDEIVNVRMMNHNNVPIKVLVYREKRLFTTSAYNNLEFVKQLSRIIADINLSGELPYREKLKLANFWRVWFCVSEGVSKKGDRAFKRCK